MIDLKLLRDQPDAVRASQRARGEDESLVDAVLAADERRRATIRAYESARAEQKAASKELGPVMGRLTAARKAQGEDVAELEAEATTLREKGAALSVRVKEREAAADAAKGELDTSLRAIGNVIQDGVPAGGEDDFTLLEEVGTPRDFAAEGFAPRDHLELGELLGAIDMERGAKVSGSRFYYLTGAGARLEWALMGLAQRIAAEEGFTPLVVPTLVRPETMAGTGYLDAHDDVYHLPTDDLYLTGTSEVALAGFHADEILDLGGGPIRYVATSTCYRREAGSYGKDTRGIFRVHQFQKTEMFVFCRPEDAVAEHENLLRIERRVLDALELPYRIIDVAAGDLGGPASRKYDCEAWVPTQSKYRELTSTSNCTTFQARRLGIRERHADGSGTRTLATLNGTAITSTRPIVAILENHQQADGSVRVPQALRPFLGVDVLTPR